LVEMGADVAGRDHADGGRKKRRSMVRIPADEVPRPNAAPSANGTPGRAVAAAPVDDLVEHAFSNGGQAEGRVAAVLQLQGYEPDELAQLDDELVDDLEEDLEGDAAVVEQAARDVDEALADEPVVEALEPDSDPRVVGAGPADPSASIAALVHAVPIPPPSTTEAGSSSPWSDSSTPDPDEPVLSSVAPPTPSARPVAVGSEMAGRADDQRADAKVLAPPTAGPTLPPPSTAAPPVAPPKPAPPKREDEEELDGGEVVEMEAPPAEEVRPRTMTPVVPPIIQPYPVSNSAPQAIPPLPKPAPPPPPPAAAPPHPPVAPPHPPSATPPHLPATPPHPPAATPPHLPAVAIPPPHPPAAPPHPPAATPPSGAPVTAAGAPAARQAPPPMPPASPPAATPAAAGELRPRKKRRTKQWFEEIFDDDYLRTLPYLTARQTEREAAFVAESLGVSPGSALLDLGCGYGRHAMELAGKGYTVTGLDLSLPLLIRAADAARRSALTVNFIHGDMREMSFEDEFDGAYCMFTSFGYFDDDTNRKVAANLARAIKPGGRLLLDVVNRDYLVRDLPTRVWWQGEGCVVLEEVDFNYFSSRLQVQRSIIFEDGRQTEQEISIRAYSLHEIGKILHHAGFRVTEVSGGLALRGKFFGASSRQLIVLAEKKPGTP
jgi:SAM-dependent methyltransferase